MFFPLLTLLRAWIFPRPWQRSAYTPSISLVIVCYNEATEINAKLQNIGQLDYPPESVQIIVASDGSDDGTDEIVKVFPDDRIQLFTYPRRGKIPALNDAVQHATGEFLVFTDANSKLSQTPSTG